VKPDDWDRTWEALGCDPPAGLLGELRARYSEPDRFYHTLEHLRECFEALAPAAALAERLPEVQLAIWFHDAVYDTRASDNEERSGRLAREALVAAGAAAAVAARVEALVLATRHDAVPRDADARLVVDLDLGILGASAARFDEYESQIRREYSWVPDSAFRDARAAVLTRFLERPSIYRTAWFASRLEQRARENLVRSLRQLS
jgi:predicted metal-dependent HD superfamily phosphohydrolase